MLQPGQQPETLRRLRDYQTMRRAGVDGVDVRRGAYDPVSRDGLPQPHQVKDRTTTRQKEQWGADVRAEPLPGDQPALPEGLTRPRRGPLNASSGRRAGKTP